MNSTDLPIWLSEDDDFRKLLVATPRTWLVTGVAGFIGSHLLETLLRTNQMVRGVDNFSTGKQQNLDEVKRLVGPKQWSNFQFEESDINDLQAGSPITDGVQHVLHQAALGSVPRSLADPLATNQANVTGFLNVLELARKEKVSSFLYAASSSTYGDNQRLPKVEPNIGSPLSPYAATKLFNEIYSNVYFRCFKFVSIGLRYFNVFGPRQDPNGAYAAVIPKWTASMIAEDVISINGDGETSRDFTYVDNVVQANLRASLWNTASQDEVFNVAHGSRTTLNSLFTMIKDQLKKHGYDYEKAPEYQDFRPGDVRHSLASIDKARAQLGYSPSHDLERGLADAMSWYIDNQLNK